MNRSLLLALALVACTHPEAAGGRTPRRPPDPGMAPGEHAEPDAAPPEPTDAAPLADAEPPFDAAATDAAKLAPQAPRLCARGGRFTLAGPLVEGLGSVSGRRLSGETSHYRFDFTIGQPVLPACPQPLEP